MAEPGPLRIAVAGGSIGGLSAGIALHGAGFDVQVYEQHPGPMDSRGAGIVLQPELARLLQRHGAPPLPTTRCAVRRYLSPEGGPDTTERAPQEFTSWEAIYTTMRATFPEERYHAGSTLSAFETDRHAVAALVDGATRIEVDVLVCADGSQSASRRRLLPDVESAYAGYVAWRGTLDESEAPEDLVAFLDDAFTFCDARSGGHMLVYLIPGDGADARIGHRRLNWVWYVGADAAQRDQLLVDVDGVRHRASLREGQASAAAVAALSERARRELHPVLARLVEATSQPFLQSIVDVVVPRLVFGRTCLLGDAAFVVRPHTAGAAAKAARDASMLAFSLRAAGKDSSAGLRRYEEQQLEYGRGMAAHGIALGRWARQAVEGDA